jgi:prepilin-type N-terminal cleavage/methylation domain-containing protein
MKTCTSKRRWPTGKTGLTLVEVVISLSIFGIAIGAVISGHIFALHQAEMSAYSLAAHSLALQRLEQARAAKWDPLAAPPVDDLVQTNFPPVFEILDIPISGSNYVTAEIHTQVRQVSANPPLKMVRVDCIWPFMTRGFFTNTVVTYRAPDQ